MADTDRSEAISEFCNLTGVDATRARFYLEAANWDTNLASVNFFEEADEEPEEIPQNIIPRSGSPKPIPPTTGGGGAGARIATFANLANEADDEEEGQAFYAGGSERSGQQVLGPRKRQQGNQIVEDMFNAVRKYGGEVLDQSARKSSKKSSAFRGTGFVLGSTPDQSGSVNNDVPEHMPQEVEIRLSLWQSGFTIDNGPLRDYTEPQNKEFLDAIRKGEIPMELRQQAAGREVHLSLEDHSHEEYVPPRRSLQAFTGTGFRLGSISPVVVSAPAGDNEKNVELAQEGMQVDDSKPVTNIQIRLTDGARLVMKANHSHTVGDIRRYIVQARPEYGASVFALMTSFPVKELSDDAATVEEANLLNAVIVQKMK